MTRAIDEIEILNLVDGNVTQGRLLGEAGYSALVKVTYDDSSKFTFLLDASSSAIALAHNMVKLDKVLTNVKMIVLSHGHWDHVGGLLDTLNLIGGKPPVLCHPDALIPKTFTSDDGKKHEVGSQKYFTESKLRSKTEVITSREPYRISDGILTTGEVPRSNSFEKLTGNLLKMTTTLGGNEVLDPINDDLSVIFQLKDGSVVILAGCCHAGIVNTVTHTVDITGSSSIIGIVGGFHLHDASNERLTKTIEHLQEYPLSTVAPCHCTGLRGRAILMYTFGDQFKDIGVGSVIKFTSN